MRSASKLGVVAVLLAALILRVAGVLVLGDLVDPLTWEYGPIAASLERGEGFTYAFRLDRVYHSWMPPLYPALLALHRAVFGAHGYLALYITQCMLSTATVALAGLLAMRLGGHMAGWAAMVMASLYPPLAVKVAYLDPVTVETFLLLAAVWLCIKALDGDGVRPAAGSGLLLALAVLARPTLLAFAVGLMLTWCVMYRQRIRAGLVLMACVIAGMTPWMARNAMVHGQVVMISSNAGYNFWIGNNPLATGHAYADDGQPVWMHMPPELQQRVAAVSEVEQSRLLYGEGIQWIRENPGRFLELTLRRLAFFVWFRPGAGTGQMDYPQLWQTGYKAVYGLLLLLAGWGAWWWGRHWRRLLPVYVLIGSVTAVYSVFFIHTRYRMILEVFLIVLAAPAALCATRLVDGRWRLGMQTGARE